MAGSSAVVDVSVGLVAVLLLLSAVARDGRLQHDGHGGQVRGVHQVQGPLALVGQQARVSAALQQVPGRRRRHVSAIDSPGTTAPTVFPMFISSATA